MFQNTVSGHAVCDSDGISQLFYQHRDHGIVDWESIFRCLQTSLYFDIEMNSTEKQEKLPKCIISGIIAPGSSRQ